MNIDDLIALRNSKRGPKESIRVQKIVVGFCNVLSKEYGASKVNGAMFSAWINEFAQRVDLTDLLKEELADCLDQMAGRLDPKGNSLRFSNEDLILYSGEIDWGTDSTVRLVEEFLRTKILVRPDSLLDRARTMEERLQTLSNNKYSLVLTSSLRNKSEIRDAITKIVETAEKRLYIMIAFFGEELDFFPEYLGIVSTLKNLDLRILLRDPMDAKANSQIASQVATNLEGRDVVRIYSPYYYVGNQRGIGNLHSKMILSEKYVMIGSANLTRQSLLFNEESALFTNDASILEDARRHFEGIWNQFKPVGR